MLYIIHHCANLKCPKGWLDKDHFNSSAPQKWKYCQDCESAGLVSPTVEEERARRQAKYQAKLDRKAQAS